MKKNAYADTTTKATGKRLEHLERNCNLDNPEQVKGFIANKQCSSAFKESLVEAYSHYCNANGLKWNKPFYRRYDKLPKIPTTEHLNMLIANARPKMVLFLSMSKDLGTRPIELTWLKVKDIDLKSGIVTITSAKHCNGRTLKLKNRTVDILKQHIQKYNLNQNDLIFPTSSDHISDVYRRHRNALAKKLQIPTIAQIRLYDFRHYFASMLYHKTKDLLLVKYSLGHKDLRQTLRYTQLLETTEDDEYTCKVAKTIDEATALVELGFEYITEMDGLKLFRKRK